MEKKTRRGVLTGGAAAAVAVGVGTAVGVAQGQSNGQGKGTRKKVQYGKGGKPTDGKMPLYSPAVQFGNMLFLSGKGRLEGGDIRTQTRYVLDELKALLEASGSSTDKVLKASVFLKDIGDYDAMNEIYRGFFGAEPPARTTVAVASIPFNCLVEIDVIAHT